MNESMLAEIKAYSAMQISGLFPEGEPDFEQNGEKIVLVYWDGKTDSYVFTMSLETTEALINLGLADPKLDENGNLSKYAPHVDLDGIVKLAQTGELPAATAPDHNEAVG